MKDDRVNPGCDKIWRLKDDDNQALVKEVIHLPAAEEFGWGRQTGLECPASANHHEQMNDIVY